MGFFEENALHIYRFEWGIYLFTAVFGLIAAISYAVVTPNVRPFFVNDATVWYDQAPDTVPYWSVLLFAAICAAVVGLAEYACAPRSSLETRIGHWIIARVICMMGAAVLLTIACTETLKDMVGELRPGFARACLGPDVPPYTYSGTTILSNDDCPHSDSETLDHLRKGFPSGHTSVAFCAAVYSSLHLLWRSVIARSHKPEISRPLWMSHTFSVCGLFPLFTAVLVAVSRVIDYHHNTADVVAGALLGGMVAAYCFSVVSGNLLKDYRFILLSMESQPISLSASHSTEPEG